MKAYFSEPISTKYQPIYPARLELRHHEPKRQTAFEKKIGFAHVRIFRESCSFLHPPLRLLSKNLPLKQIACQKISGVQVNEQIKNTQKSCRNCTYPQAIICQWKSSPLLQKSNTAEMEFCIRQCFFGLWNRVDSRCLERTNHTHWAQPTQPTLQNQTHNKADNRDKEEQ